MKPDPELGYFCFKCHLSLFLKDGCWLFYFLNIFCPRHFHYERCFSSFYRTINIYRVNIFFLLQTDEIKIVGDGFFFCVGLWLPSPLPGNLSCFSLYRIFWTQWNENLYKHWNVEITPQTNHFFPARSRTLGWIQMNKFQGISNVE